MAATRDKFGRPIVVVTGMGVVTSLGSGKADNWKKLTAGESGIRTITRFPTDGLKTTMAGTVDFIPVEPFSSTDLSERLGELVAQEAIAQAIARVGGPITASAATVICGIGMLAFARLGKIHNAGLVIPLSLVLVLCAALTFAPSLLRFMGPWVFWPRALTERTFYDGDGQLLSGSYMDYALPRADGCRRPT